MGVYVSEPQRVGKGKLLLTPIEIDARLERVLPTVQKPGRYTGGEYNQVVKDWDTVHSHVAFVFPDIYDLGMSNLGLAILYDIVNRRPDALAERTYLPWQDMESAMRDAGIPLYSLESHRPLSNFDIVGISLPYESLYTNALHTLDLAGIPLRSSERTSRHPLIIAGGQATFNPEPMSAFIDAFVIGEGEEVILEVINTEWEARQRGDARPELLHSLARIPGVYVPQLYEAEYGEGGIFKRLIRLSDDAPLPVVKRFVPRLPPPPTKFIVPYIETVHNRIPIEIMRGCTRGCRFCHAGMVNRPVRERPVAEIVSAVEAAVAATGYEEIGLLSLSSSDYSHILELVQAINERFCGKDQSASHRRLAVSLPSLRIETFSVDLVEALAGSRKHGGFTLAPEAATERMRRIINKPVSTDQLLETARVVYGRGFPTIKLYFMIGHPSETLEDVRSIAELCKAVLAEGRKTMGKRAEVHAGVSTFVPKPHTPFQWTPCDTVDQILAKQEVLKKELRMRGIKLTWTKPEETLLEAWLSRGDRRMSEVIFGAWQRGAIFDAWQDRFNYTAWVDAFAAASLDPSFYTHRPRAMQEAFPWDHIHAGVRKKYLLQDYQWSQENRIRPDCREQCFGCGILPLFVEARRKNTGDWWKCPEVRPRVTNGSPQTATRKIAT
jgi:radical SAM family uncharacterized protein